MSRKTQAELVAVGSELLTPDRADTNTLWLTEQLNRHGISVSRKTIIGDDIEALVELFSDAGRRADLVIACGGLGPTFDDVTREALAQALGLELEYHEKIYGWICARYRLRGRTPTENNKRQAMVPAGGLFFKNDVGTAPGLLIHAEGCSFALLPGPPAELQFVFGRMADELLSRFDTQPMYKRIFKLVGLPESGIDDRLRSFKLPLADRMEWSILASYGQVEIHLRARSVSAAEAGEAFDEAGLELRSLFGSYIFGQDDDTLESVVGGLLRSHGHTLAVAESCSGGWLAHRLTDVPGSSDYFYGGVVSYHNSAKVNLLDVSSATLEEHRAVSEPTALEMARGARRRFGVDVSVGITGVAGPAGGSPGRPVGTVFIAVINADGSERCYRMLFPGDRDKIRFQATQLALAQIRFCYLDEPFESIYIVDK